MEGLQSPTQDETNRTSEYPLLQGLEKCEKDLFDLLLIVNSGDFQRLPDFLNNHQDLLIASMICRIGSSDFDATCSFIMSRQTMWQPFSDDLYGNCKGVVCSERRS